MTSLRGTQSPRPSTTPTRTVNTDPSTRVNKTSSAKPATKPTESKPAPGDTPAAPARTPSAADAELKRRRLQADGAALQAKLSQEIPVGKDAAQDGPRSLADSLTGVRSEDAKTRAASLKTLQQQAAAGNRQAIDALGKVAGDDLYDVPYDARSGLREGATKGLVGAKEHLNKKDYENLGRAVQDHYEVGRAGAAKLIGEQIKSGNQAAIDGTRAAGRDPYGTNAKPAELLAKNLPADQRTAGDYKLFQESGGLDGRSARAAALQDGLARGDDGAVSAVKSQLHGDSYSDYPTSEQANAAKALGAHPQHIDGKDLTQLEKLATPKGDSHFNREDALTAIGAAAKHGTPGAVDAFTRVADKIPPHPGKKTDAAYDGYGDLRREAAKSATDIFKSTNDPAVREQVAHVGLADVRNGDDAIARTDALKGRAAKGDPAALQSLAAATDGDTAKGRDAASALLGDAGKNGQAGPVTDALLKERDIAKGHSRGKLNETLGAAAAELPAGDARIDKTRAELRSAMSDRHNLGDDDSAARGLGALGEKGRLGTEDYRALSAQKSTAAADALVKSSPHMSDTQRREVLDSARDDLLPNFGRQSGGSRVFEGMTEHLNAKDVDALRLTLPTGSRSSRYGPTARDVEGGKHNAGVLGKVLTDHQDPAVQRAAAHALAERSPDVQSKTTRDALVDHAAQSGDAALKQKVLGQLPRSPIGKEHLEDVARTYGRDVGKAIENAREGTPMHKLGELLKARSMADDKEWGEHVDVTKVDKKIADLTGKEPLKGKLENIRRGAIDKAVPKSVGEKQAAYLGSDGFQQRLKLLSPADQKKAVQQELTKLHGVAPDKVPDAAASLRGKLIEENTARSFHEIGSRDDQANAVSSAISNSVKGVSGTNQIAGHITDAMRKLPANTPRSLVGRKVVEGLEQMQRAARRAGDTEELSRLGKTLNQVRKWNDSGKLPAILTGASLIGLATKGLPKNGVEATAMASTLMSAAGSAHDIGKLFKLDDATKLGKVMKGMKWLGPAGDIAGAVVDGIGSVQDFQANDYVGGTAKAVGAASGLVGAGAGIAILAGATGPGAPLVLAGAAAVGLIAWGVDSWFGKSKEQEFLEGLGVYK